MYSKNAWEKYEGKKLEELMSFNEDYKHFITVGKTERACVKESVALARAKGFKELHEYKELKAGDKVYFVNKNKNIACRISRMSSFSISLSMMFSPCQQQRQRHRRNTRCQFGSNDRKQKLRRKTCRKSQMVAKYKRS